MSKDNKAFHSRGNMVDRAGNLVLEGLVVAGYPGVDRHQ
jgi:hypothetical protein